MFQTLVKNNIEDDYKYRKSKYSGLKIELDNLYRDSWMEVDTKNMEPKKSKMNFIDLFAGAGGMSLGIKNAGFNKFLDIEILPYACETLKRNFRKSKHYCGDIVDFNLNDYLDPKKDKIHLVAGGPPCQGFSIAGKRNPKDQRNFLFKKHYDIVEGLMPDFFVIENVPGIITLNKGSFYKEIMDSFTKIGYTVSVRILESACYGVPQLRSRAIFIGNKHKLKNPYPKEIYDISEYNTIDMAISDLEDMPRNKEFNHEWTKHKPDFIKRIEKVLPGESLYKTFKDAYKRQRYGEPSMTIKENHGGTHIHYKLNRCISTREMARIQTFPDDFIFEGTHKQGFIQVGNAVPPLLAKHIGLALMTQFEKIY